MKNNPTWLPVVAGWICRADDEFLLHQRPAGKPHAGQWEFPGGKVEPSENPREALCRELLEELGIAIMPQALQPTAFIDDLPANPVVLILYRITEWGGDPAALEGGEIDWVDSTKARMLDLSPLDRRLLEMILRP